MEENEFVKKFGWLRAKQILKNSEDSHRCFIADGISTTYSKYGDGFYSLAKLKHLIESHELVAIHGFEKSKEIVANAPSDDHFYSWALGGSGVRDKTVNIGELRKAIADVESCL